MGLRKGPGSCISDTFPFEGQRPYLITAGLENFVTTIPVKANLINVGYSWTPKEPYQSFSDAAPSFFSAYFFLLHPPLVAVDAEGGGSSLHLYQAL